MHNQGVGGVTPPIRRHELNFIEQSAIHAADDRHAESC